MSKTLGNNYKKALNKYAKALNQTAQRVLGRRRIGKNKSYGEASGKLRNSLTYKVRGDSIQFSSSQPSAKFIYWGVNGTERNHRSPFSYKDKAPPIDPIMQWMKVKPLRLRDEESGKFIKQTESRLRSAAYVIAQAIKRKGIASLKYYEIAYESTLAKWSKILADAIAKDLLEDLDDELKTDENIDIK